jgi:O-antigen/teichoic acid export membrane protein
VTGADDTTAALGAALRRRLATGFAWNLLGAVFNQGSTFAVSLIVANLLGRQLFGNYAILQGLITTLTAVGQVSSGYTATKYVAEFRAQAPDRAGRILGLCIVFSASMAALVSVASAACAPLVAANGLKAPGLAGAVVIGSVAVFFGIVSGTLVGGLNGLEDFRAAGVAGVWSGTSYILICSFAAWKWGLFGAVLGLAVSAWVQFVVLSVALIRAARERGVPLAWVGVWRERPILVAFSLPAAIAGATSPAAIWLSQAVLARESGYDQLALFSSANSLRVLVLFLPLVMNTVSASLLNQHRGLREWDSYRRVFRWNLGITLALVCVGSLALAAGGPLFLSLYGKSFREGYPILVCLALSTIPEGVTSSIYQVVKTEAAMWVSLVAIAVPRDVLLVVLAYVFAPPRGALGVSVAYVLSSCAALGLASWVAWRIYPARTAVERGAA